MKRVLASISIILDAMKSFIIAIIIILSIIIAIVSILHNVFKIREIYKEDTTGYKKLISVDENRMNVQVTGNGDKTIVILSDFATLSPIIQYKTYVDRLQDSYKVVVIEYFGYGFSLSTKEERTSEKIAYEVKTALEQSNITGSYTILANGISSLYAYTYANIYSEEVENLIIVDGVYPATIEDNYLKELIEEQKTNAIINSYMEKTGFARIASYIKPENFAIDKMKENNFSESDISLYRTMIANRFYTSTMRNEIKKLSENMENLKDYALPEYLPTTQILSKEYTEEYQNYKKDKLIDKDIQEYANDIITNSEIQKVVVIDGKKNLNLYNPDGVIQVILSE